MDAGGALASLPHYTNIFPVHIALYSVFFSYVFGEHFTTSLNILQNSSFLMAA